MDDTRSGPVHTRMLAVRVEERAPSRWSAHGVILDLRKRGLVPMARDLQTAGVIHHMRVEAEIDVSRAELVRIRAEQPTVAFEASPGTGGECCRDPVSRIESLAGTALDAGFARGLGAAVGGPRGCSHVHTLALCVASTAERALAADRALHGEAQRASGTRIFQRSLSIDGLAASDGALDLEMQLSDVHFAPTPPDADPFAMLARHEELRVHASIDLDTLTLRRLGAAERRTQPGSPEPSWRDRDADVAWLSGQGAMGGLARAVLARVVDPHDAPLRDALLNLSPTLVQCIPAISERWRSRTAAGSPSLFASGGMLDSCYMWRRGGFLSQRIEAELRDFRASRQDGRDSKL
ncbi:MAG TPA: DUF2889 domain-containing protein [Myxococcota bacterium]|nr:DUF2889 domain-containing protein [Myxococcota bacterium]